MTTHPRFFAAALTASAIAAAATPALAQPRTVTVYVFNYGYSQVHPNPPYPNPLPPDEPTINVGDTIRWVRVNGTHDVRSALGSPEQFVSPIITAAAPYTHTYTNPGRFYYYCSFHGFDLGDGFAGGMASFVDVVAPPEPCPGDFGVAGGGPGQDGLLDNNDFIAFIDLFFASDPRADIGTAGGLPGSDGVFDNNDVIAFIDRFFAGCP